MFEEPAARKNIGQDLIEYGLIALMVTLGVIAGMGKLANSINALFSHISSSLFLSSVLQVGSRLRTQGAGTGKPSPRAPLVSIARLFISSVNRKARDPLRFVSNCWVALESSESKSSVN